MHVLILGGTGFIGPPVARKLVESGHSVTVFHRNQHSEGLPAEVRHLYGDWGNPRQRPGLLDFRDQFASIKPDIVIDMLMIGEEDAKTVLQTFTGMVKRIVAISSQDVYRAYARFNGKELGPADPVPITEESPLRDTLYPYRSEATTPEDWRNYYDKIPGERLLLNNPGTPATVLRLPAVYGPGDRQYRFYTYLKRMFDGRAHILLGENFSRWLWTNGYVEEIGAAIALAATDERAAGKIYNLGEAETPTFLQRLERLAQVVGWEGEFVLAPEANLPEGLRMDLFWEQQLVVDSARIREELGYQEAVPEEQGYARTARWEQQNPPKKIDPAEFDYELEDKLIASLD